MLNVIAVMGRLVADPELRKTPNGISTVRFAIACDRSFCKAGEQRQTDFLDVVAWRGTAEFVCKYFKKGQMIALDGSLQTNNYEDKNGNKRKSYEIVAGNVNFAESKKQQSTAVGGIDYSQAKVENGGGGNFDDGLGVTEAPPQGFEPVEEGEDLPF